MAGAAAIMSRIRKRIGEYCRPLKKPKLQVECEWKHLSDDLVSMIARKLGDDIADRVRMRMVCKSWYAIIDLQLPQVPWLLLPHDPNPKTMKFYDMSCDKVHQIRLSSGQFGSTRSTKGWYCFGSSKGWLVIVEKSYFRFDIFLLNPITGDRHQLPCLKTVPAFNDVYYTTHHLITTHPHNKVQLFINRVILSSENLSKCVVAAVFDDNRVLACCRPNDKKWTVLKGVGVSDRLEDCLFYKAILFSNEILYATIRRHGQNKIAAKSYTLKLSDDNFEVRLKLLPRVDLVVEGDSVETRMMSDEPVEAESHTQFDKFGIHSFDNFESIDYLIEANGDILLVRKRVDILWPDLESLGNIRDDVAEYIYNHNTAEYHRTRSFDVFKICLDEYTDDEGCTPFSVSRVKSLDGGVMFLAATGSTYAKQALQSGRGDCIYFADDFLYYYQRYDPHVSCETGIYDLKNGKIQRPFPSIKIPRQSNMCWFTPNIR